MACYVDTRAWVALLGREANAEPIEQWMMRGMPLMTSAWTKVEIARALSIIARRGELDQALVSDICRAFKALLGVGGVAQMDCVDTDFQEAALLCEHVASGQWPVASGQWPAGWRCLAPGGGSAQRQQPFFKF
jgi:uncharacterized protein with PIN domain